MDQWQALVILPLVIAFVSDAFALFAGMAFGKHKLAPELSPKKDGGGGGRRLSGSGGVYGALRLRSPVRV